MYLIDSDVLITAKNSYYAFDLCPGFWNSLLDQHQSGQVHSLDRNRMDLPAGQAGLRQGRDEDQLVKWVKDSEPADFFLSTHQTDVAATCTEVMLWAQRNPQYFDSAKAKFATGADGWLVAYLPAAGRCASAW
jgi:hypothetical protein